MFLSLLHVNVGDDPEREQPGRRWLRDVYRVHQRLWMAFPDAKRLAEDPFFLGTWEEPALPEPEPKPKRSYAGFLFRIEREGRPRILVQSAQPPHWDYAFQNAAHLLAAPPETKTVDPRFESGQHLRFRLLANPTKRLRKESQNANGQAVPDQSVGKRVPVPVSKLEDWLIRRAERRGFRVRELNDVRPGYVYVNRSAESGDGQRLRSVRYEGLLEVVDAESLSKTIIHGIGPAKAFGFGLLSIAPVR